MMAGFREFLTGEVLTSANVNDFLMKQSVMVFVDAAARTAALGAEVAEGMLTYNLDTDQLEVFDGAAFVSVASPPTPPTTSATDLTSGTLANARLAAGTIVQVVQTTKTNVFSSSSTSFVNVTGLSATITPSATSSKILVLAFVNHSDHGTVAGGSAIRLSGGNSVNFVGDAAGSRRRAAAGYEGSSEPANASTIVFLDAPATTAARTYVVQINGVGGQFHVNRGRQDNDDSRRVRSASSIVVMEVKG